LYYGPVEGKKRPSFLRFSIDIIGRQLAAKESILKDFIGEYFGIMKQKAPAGFFG